MVLKDYYSRQASDDSKAVVEATADAERQEELVEQLAFPDVSPYQMPAGIQQQTESVNEAASQRDQISFPNSEPGFLPQRLTNSLQNPPSQNIDKPARMSGRRTRPAPQKQTVIIPATGQKSAGTMRAPKGRTRVVHLGVCIALVAIVLTTLAAVLPADTQGHGNGLGLFQPVMRMISSQRNDTALIAAQAATATAVTQDGYEYNGAGGNHPFAGVNTNITPAAIPAPGAAPAAPGGFDANFSNPFSPGQCTWWADYRYHQLTGFAVPWSGNASAWAYNAPAYGGWVVSDTPRVPSIIVLQPGVQYASGWGHVAVVERINPDGSVYTSNYNIIGWGVLSYATYHPAPGVSFVYHI